MFRSGWGVPTDYTEAAKWLRLAADQRNAEAQHDLGNLYMDGKGVQQDYAEAAKWLRLAADQGHVPSQEELGFVYASGQGVQQDYVSAYTWYSLAAARGGKYSPDRRDLIAKQMTPDQIAKGTTPGAGVEADLP